MTLKEFKELCATRIKVRLSHNNGVIPFFSFESEDLQDIYEHFEENYAVNKLEVYWIDTDADIGYPERLHIMVK